MQCFQSGYAYDISLCVSAKRRWTFTDFGSQNLEPDQAGEFLLQAAL